VLLALERLLTIAPRLGLITETYRLLETIHEMERRHPADPTGPGAMTEFDRLFDKGARGIVECLVDSSASWQPEQTAQTGGDDRSDELLVECLERASERLLRRWLEHSRNVRLSVLETVSSESRWRKLKSFVKRYGNDIFAQLMNIGNLRAILHQGVDRYLDSLAEEPGSETEFQLLRDLDGVISREDAVRNLGLTIEAVVENYPEYIDYNSTTTQSDRGEMLYTLLDFLRLRTSYDRVAWNLKPVMIAHEVMVRRGRLRAAERWREAVVERTRQFADEHLEKLEKMCRRYAMRLASIADRLNERFVRPLDVDRLCALVRPAIQELRQSGGGLSFHMLEAETARFTQEPSGVGFDLPFWLEALEEEVESACADASQGLQPDDIFPNVGQIRLTPDDVRRELGSWDEA
jgi:hypothetical protein